MNKSFDVFLSHNSKDKPAVRELAEALRARGVKVWLDEWELAPGGLWQEELEEIIKTTRAAAVLVGKDGIGPWQDKEMRGCLSEFVERKLPVIPVLLPGAPEKPMLPFFLKGFTWADLRGGLTEAGIDQLHWGITGTKPDRSKVPMIPAADSKAPAAAEMRPATAEVRPAPPEVQAPVVTAKERPPQKARGTHRRPSRPQTVTVTKEQPAQKARASSESSLGFGRAFHIAVAWTLTFSAAIPAFQAMVGWPATPTFANWFWFLVRWFILLASSFIFLAAMEINDSIEKDRKRLAAKIERDSFEREYGSYAMTETRDSLKEEHEDYYGGVYWGFAIFFLILFVHGLAHRANGKAGSVSVLFFPGNLVYVIFAALAGGFCYSIWASSSNSSRIQYLGRWLFWAVAWLVVWWLSVYLLGLIPAGQIDPFTRAFLGVLLVYWWMHLIHLGLKRLRWGSSSRPPNQMR